MKPKMNMIVIPDLHGRTFWKEAVSYVEAGVPCLFLGDYVDPYPFESIGDLDALKNLREVLSFANAHRDRVTLLLGNHDLSYLGDPWGQWTVYADRFSDEWADIISELFNENSGLFSLCACREVAGRTFLFSHAGLHPVWVEWCGLFDSVDKNDAWALAARVEELYCEAQASDDRTEFMKALEMIGAARGDNAFAGSMVWADISEYDDTAYPFTQVFGHTAQRGPNGEGWGEPCAVSNNICVDCARCFYLDDEGALRSLDDHKTVRL